MLSQIAFVESSSAYGVNASYGTGFVGGGISFCDFDGDGLDDLTLAGNSGSMISFYRNTAAEKVIVFVAYPAVDVTGFYAVLVGTQINVAVQASNVRVCITVGNEAGQQ